MKMKRNIFWLGMLVIILAFGITACGGDDGGDDNNNNNNTGGVTVPTDLQGVWKMTASNSEGGSASSTYTFTANSLVTTANVTANGVTVTATATYNVTASTSATNNDNATKTEFPSGYTLTLLVTAIEGGNSGGLNVGDTISPTLYLNTAKNKMNYVGNVGNAYTKQ
jgi:hypothetical protein